MMSYRFQGANEALLPDQQSTSIPNDFEDAFEVGSFELAIHKLRRRISAAKDRAHIVITGRTAAWRPENRRASIATLSGYAL